MGIPDHVDAEEELRIPAKADIHAAGKQQRQIERMLAAEPVVSEGDREPLDEMVPPLPTSRFAPRPASIQGRMVNLSLSTGLEACLERNLEVVDRSVYGPERAFWIEEAEGHVLVDVAVPGAERK